jgi:hypothetical protein
MLIIQVSSLHPLLNCTLLQKSLNFYHRTRLGILENIVFFLSRRREDIRSLILRVYLKVSFIQAFRYESLSKHFTSTGDSGVGISIWSSLYSLFCFSGFFASWYRQEVTVTDVWKDTLLLMQVFRARSASYCKMAYHFTTLVNCSDWLWTSLPPPQYV